MIDFSIDPVFQEKLTWVRGFVRDQVELVDALFPDPDAPFNPHDEQAMAVVRPLQQEVRRQGLWGLHLPPELGGPGFGQVELCHLNEILGATIWGPTIFGCQAPDSGNSEILARFGTPEQKDRWLKPLLENEIVSCFSMTEVEGGSDPTQFTLKAELVGDEWVINGEKWFSSNARFAGFLIVMAVTDPDAASRHERMSAIIVPAGTPGLTFVSEPGIAGEPLEMGSHAHLRYENVRVPASSLLGPRGQGFMVAQSRLGGGRIHHAMRAIGMCRKALEMMCERAHSRTTQGETLSHKQLVQMDIGQCWIDLEQFKLLVLRTAWMFDTHQEEEARSWIAACKVACAQVTHKIIFKAMHLLGSLGISNQTPLSRMWGTVLILGMADGPTEIHQIYAGRHVLRANKATAPGRFPSNYLPHRIAEAEAHFGVKRQGFRP
ncbi:MAG: acyl-CoA dehydrogenase family protein [Azospirillaceae bacterium]|nr:acyl-CoA dehydrogenase family protein [Azospirillaceae bacterium]